MQVKARGLPELRRDLRNLGPTARHEIERADRAIAEMIADRARTEARGRGGAARKTAPSVHPTVVGGVATVTAGGPGYPFAAGAEFGARHNVLRMRRTGPYLGYNQFEPPRARGYFLNPTVDAADNEMVAIYSEALDRALRNKGL